ncbi:MAG: transposase, partial [Bacteroidaceae bacterium]
ENKALAEYALAQIQLLYNLERHIRENDLPPDKILEKRREIALPIINQIKSWIEENYPKVLPGSRIGKAMSYNS